MNGILLVDKPAGWTSFDVVAKVRGVIRAANRRAMDEGAAVNLPKRVKVGHTGTLDPLATGLLVLLVGNFTKRAPELTKLDKTYDVMATLGQVSTTGDEEGDKRTVNDFRPPLEQLRQALQQFTGDIMQTPPAFSAMKVNGVRAYKLARQGQEVVLEPRPARIDRLDMKTYEYPLLNFTAEVSSGTYIRSLVQDLGQTLGCGAYMSGLRRTRVGTFDVVDGLSVEQLQADVIAASLLDQTAAP